MADTPFGIGAAQMEGDAQYKREALGRAVAMVSTAFISPDGTGRADLVALFDSYATDDPGHEITALVGLQNLAQVLLVRMERKFGVDPLTELQEIAAKYVV